MPPSLRWICSESPPWPATNGRPPTRSPQLRPAPHPQNRVRNWNCADAGWQPWWRKIASSLNGRLLSRPVCSASSPAPAGGNWPIARRLTAGVAPLLRPPAPEQWRSWRGPDRHTPGSFLSHAAPTRFAPRTTARIGERQAQPSAFLRKSCSSLANALPHQRRQREPIEPAHRLYHPVRRDPPYAGREQSDAQLEMREAMPHLSGRPPACRHRCQCQSLMFAPGSFPPAGTRQFHHSAQQAGWWSSA